MIYSDAVRDWFGRAPAFVAPLSPGPGLLLQGSAGREEDGVRVEFEIRLAAGPAAQVAAAAFRAFGCPHVVAACALLCGWLPGRPAAALARAGWAGVLAPLEIPAEKSASLMIIEDALRNCLTDWDNSRLPTT